LSLKLLVDEDSQAKLLVDLLRKASHDVVIINELKLSGSDDTVVFDYAIKQKRAILTQNCQDFEILHSLNSNHAGILGIYQNNYAGKNMTYKDIVKAMQRGLEGFLLRATQRLTPQSCFAALARKRRSRSDREFRNSQHYSCWSIYFPQPLELLIATK